MLSGKLLLKIHYNKNKYDILTLNNKKPHNYLDKYVQKCNYWKKLMMYHHYKPISYFILFDTTKNILYPFMSFSKYYKNSEYFCLSHIPLYICNINKNKFFTVLNNEISQIKYIDGKLKVDEFVTFTFPLNEINEAFHKLHSGEALRSVILLHDADSAM